MANLQDLTNQLAENNEQNIIGHERTSIEVSNMSNNLNNFIRFLKGQRLDDLERQRETGNKSRLAASQGSGAGGAGGGLTILPGLASLQGLIASIVAFSAALAGLRGWEVNAIKNIRQALGRFTDAFKTSSLKLLDDFKGRLNTRFSGILETINTRIVRFVNLILDRLGIAKFEQLRDAAGRFTGEKLSPLNKIGKFFDSVTEALKPVSKIAVTLGKITIFPLVTLLQDIAGIFTKISGFAGEKTMGSIAKLGAKFSGFLGLAAKILKPIGFIFSFVEGMSEAFKTEGDLVDKLSAGVSRFLADFFGAPLDLLMDLSGWLLKKMGFNETAEALKKFSVEEFLFDTLQGVFKFIRRAFEDPVGLGKDIIGGIVGSIQGLFNYVIKTIAAGFGIQLETQDEKNARLASNAVKQLERRIANLTGQSDNSVANLTTRRDASRAKLDKMIAEGANPMRINTQRHSLGIAESNLASAVTDERRKAAEIRALQYELQNAQSEATRLQNIVGQLGDTIISNNVTSTTGLVGTTGAVIDEEKLVLR